MENKRVQFGTKFGVIAATVGKRKKKIGGKEIKEIENVASENQYMA